MPPSTAGCASVSSLIKGNHKQQRQWCVQPNTSYCLWVYLEDLQVLRSFIYPRLAWNFSGMICLSVRFFVDERVVSTSIIVSS